MVIFKVSKKQILIIKKKICYFEINNYRDNKRNTRAKFD